MGEVETKTPMEMLTSVFDLIGIKWSVWGNGVGDMNMISVLEEGDATVVFEFYKATGEFKETW